MKIFISSKNLDKIVINGEIGETLSDIRIFIKNDLANFKLFGKDFFDIRINEDFAADTSVKSYNKCLEEVKESDFFIALYSGSSGWAPEGIDLGICHSELSTSIEISTRKTAIIDISKFFKLKAVNKDEAKRDKLFKEYLDIFNTFTNPLKLSKTNQNNDGFKNELLRLIKNIIYNHLKDRIIFSNQYYNLNTNNEVSLNWKKLKYSERDKSIIAILKAMISKNIEFSSLITDVKTIPDNMSVEDAKSFSGRPFLKDHELIESTQKTTKELIGPIHFIGVYGNATEIQVKNLIGYPDVSTIKDDFGIYVWEQNTHIQLIFLINCKTPEAVKTNFLLFNSWCKSSGEFKNIIKRAKARYHILSAINEAKNIVS